MAWGVQICYLQCWFLADFQELPENWPYSKKMGMEMGAIASKRREMNGMGCVNMLFTIFFGQFSGTS